jgi:hypothetical protein
MILNTEFLILTFFMIYDKLSFELQDIQHFFDFIIMIKSYQVKSYFSCAFQLRLKLIFIAKNLEINLGTVFS